MSELHYRLRTEGDSPARKAAAIGLGTLIGCVPLYGTHLILCAALARLFRLNRLVTYLAAHINNPLTAPWLILLSFGLGHRISQGRWPPPRLAELAKLGLLGLGRDLMVGSLLLGAGLGALFGTAAFLVSRRAGRQPRWNRLIEETGTRYLASGIFHWEFVRCKLRHDPLYRDLLARLERLRPGAVLDLGCGRGIALALASTAWQTEAAEGRLPCRTLIGVEQRLALVRVARSALGQEALIVTADLATYEPPEAGIVLLLDVLHCLKPDAQEHLLQRISRSLRTGGSLLIREPDAAMGMRFWFTKVVNVACAVAHRDGRNGFHYRRLDEWVERLEGLGLTTTHRSLWRGTPFANVLIEAQKPIARNYPARPVN
jgi:uncharacterized protein (DUF2062 family)/trans-aconitate methyltransferase